MKSKSPPVNHGLEVRYTARSFIKILSVIAKDYDISAAEFRLLRTLSDENLYTQAELANLTAMDRPYVASLVKRMTGKGLLKGQTSKIDRRRIDVTLTAKGKRIGASIFRALDAVNEKSVQGVSATELATFLKVLRLIRANLDKHEGELSAFSLIQDH